MRFIKNNLKVLIAFILGTILSGVTVYATSLIASSNVSIDNSAMQLTKNGQSVNNAQDAIEAIYTKASTIGCPTGYEMYQIGSYTLTCRSTSAPICKRATVLHTETCENGSSTDNHYCYADGYYVGGSKNTTTITYGTLGTTGQYPQTGDAFDCDVNGDGFYNSDTERFYYVSDYFDTNTQSFDTTRATLIYYKNFSGGQASDAGVAYYASANENWHGPATAIAALPNNKANGGQWRNDLLKTQDRKILSCNNASCGTFGTETTDGTTTHTIENPISPNPPLYSGKAARLLTLKEFYTGCSSLGMTPSTSEGSIKTGCNFIYENTKYAKSSKGSYGPCLENPRATLLTHSWGVHADLRYVFNYSTSGTGRGARPAIDVLYSNILY